MEIKWAADHDHQKDLRDFSRGQNGFKNILRHFKNNNNNKTTQ